MSWNYLKMAARHLSRNKVFFAINVLGLAIGMTAFFLVVQYVNYEVSYEDFHKNRDNIYRVGLERYKNGELQSASTQNFAGLRGLLKEDYPDVDAATGFYKTPANTGVFFRYGGRIFNELGGELNADSSFFKVFSSLLIKGDPNTALNDPHAVVLSESMARKVFGDAEPMGQRLERPNDGDRASDMVVTGIIKDIPGNSHFHANFVVPLEYHWEFGTEWKEDFLLTYVALKNGTDATAFGDRLNGVYRKLETKYPEVKNTRLIIQPLGSIHLTSALHDELETNGSELMVFIASLIGLIILVIAWINYINLETAHFLTRSREIGIRRIIGSGKLDLALKFLSEYVCVMAVALVLAGVLVVLLLPYFTTLTGISMSGIQWPQPWVWMTALAVLVAGSFLVGIYPAFFLLRLNPVASLKGRSGNSGRGLLLRRSLIVFQFCTSLILIALVLVIHRQLDYMKVADKKFDVEQVITVRNPTAYSSEEVIQKHGAYMALETELVQNAAVKMVSSSSAIPGTEIGFTYVNLLKRNVDDPYDPTPFKTLFVDYNYIPFYELELLAGQNFNRPRPDADWVNPWDDKDWLTLILNETATRHLGFASPEEAIGQIVEFENFQEFFQKHKIIGVIADYHHEAVKEEVLPMILSPNYGSFQQVYYSIRLHAGSDPQDALAAIESSWRKVFPEKPFDYFFLDEYYDRQFKAEVQAGRIFTSLAGIAVFIACLGILGLTMFEASTRLKEISIRKVLGASVSGLVALLSRDNFRLVVLSAALSIPMIYYAGREWLGSYPLRINLSLDLFLIPVGVVLVLVAVTGVIQTVKAATANPVENLRQE